KLRRKGKTEREFRFLAVAKVCAQLEPRAEGPTISLCGERQGREEENYDCKTTHERLYQASGVRPRASGVRPRASEGPEPDARRPTPDAWRLTPLCQRSCARQIVAPFAFLDEHFFERDLDDRRNRNGHD